MAGVDPKKAESIYEFSAKDIDGNEVWIWYQPDHPYI